MHWHSPQTHSPLPEQTSPPPTNNRNILDKKPRILGNKSKHLFRKAIQQGMAGPQRIGKEIGEEHTGRYAGVSSVSASAIRPLPSGFAHALAAFTSSVIRSGTR